VKKLSKLKKLSHSRYKTLKTCPYQFYLQYIARKSQGPSHPSALYGSAVQRVYEVWFNRGMPGGQSWLDKNTEHFYVEVAKKFKLPLSREQHEEILKDCRVGVENLYKLLDQVGQINPKTRSEVDLALPKEGLLVRGSIDFMTNYSPNLVQITDAKGYKKSDYLEDSQIQLYCFIVHRLLKIDSFRDCGYLLFNPSVNEFFPVEVDLQKTSDKVDTMVLEYNQALNLKDKLDPKPEFISCMLCGVYEHCSFRVRVSQKEVLDVTLEDSKDGLMTTSFE